MDDRARARRRLWRLAAVLCAAPALLVAGLLGYIWLREHSWTPPPIVEPSPMPAGYARRVAAAKLFDEEPYAKASAYRHRPDDPAQDPLLPLMRETAAKNQQAIAQLHAALDVPCWVPAALPGERPPGLVNSPAMGRAARVLAMASRLRQADRDWAGATDLLLDCLRLGFDLERGRDAITALNGNARAAVGAHELWLMLPRMPVATSHVAIARLEAEIEQAPSAREMTAWQAPALAQDLAQRRTWPIEPARVAGLRLWIPSPDDPQWPGNASNPGQTAWLDLWRMPSPHRRYEQRLRWLTAVAAEFDKPFGQQCRPASDGMAWVAQKSETFWESRYRWPAASANHRLLLANVALRAYRAEHGAYPARLADLVPGYLKHVPVDPYDFQPLRYRRDGDSFLCWSVGPDGRDDNARRIVRNEADSPAHGLGAMTDDVGDIVSP